MHEPSGGVVTYNSDPSEFSPAALSDFEVLEQVFIKELAAHLKKKPPSNFLEIDFVLVGCVNRTDYSNAAKRAEGQLDQSLVNKYLGSQECKPRVLN